MSTIFDKFIEIRPVVVEGEPEAHSVYFKVGVQSFCISSCCENKEHAEWFSSMFKKALANMLQESNTLSPDRERGEWQPIETAPRDGTPFLVLLEKEMLNSRMHVATFHPNVSMIGGHFHFDAPNPTHWQPLPSATEVPREG